MDRFLLKGVEPFEKNMHGNVADRWSEWRRKFEACTVAENDERKLKELALFGGADIRNVIDRAVSDEDHPTKSRYQLAMDALDKHFAPKISIAFELQKFMKAAPLPGENIDQFVDRLRQLAQCCELGDQTEKLIISQIMYTTKDMDLKAKILLNDLPLDMIVAEAREKEMFQYVLEQCQTRESHQNMTNKRSNRQFVKQLTKRLPWSERGNSLRRNQGKRNCDCTRKYNFTEPYMKLRPLFKKMHNMHIQNINAGGDESRTKCFIDAGSDVDVQGLLLVPKLCQFRRNYCSNQMS